MRGPERLNLRVYDATSPELDPAVRAQVAKGRQTMARGKTDAAAVWAAQSVKVGPVVVDALVQDPLRPRDPKVRIPRTFLRMLEETGEVGT